MCNHCWPWLLQCFPSYSSYACLIEAALSLSCAGSSRGQCCVVTLLCSQPDWCRPQQRSVEGDCSCHEGVLEVVGRLGQCSGSASKYRVKLPELHRQTNLSPLLSFFPPPPLPPPSPPLLLIGAKAVSLLWHGLPRVCLGRPKQRRMGSKTVCDRWVWAICCSVVC